jgi:hypothetical protein
VDREDNRQFFDGKAGAVSEVEGRSPEYVRASAEDTTGSKRGHVFKGVTWEPFGFAHGASLGEPFVSLSASEKRCTG